MYGKLSEYIMDYFRNIVYIRRSKKNKTTFKLTGGNWMRTKIHRCYKMALFVICFLCMPVIVSSASNEVIPESLEEMQIEELDDSETETQLWQDGMLLGEQTFEVELTLQEREYVLNKPKIRVGYVAGMAPYTYLKDGEIQGVSVELLQLIGAGAGIDFEFVLYENQEEMDQALIAGEIEMEATCNSKEDNALYSDSYLTSPAVMIYNMNFSSEAISDNIEAVVIGSGYNFLNEEHETLEVNNYEEAIQSVMQKKADYSVVDYYAAAFYNYGNLFLSTELLSTTSDTYMCFNKDVDTRLVSICDKYLEIISDQDKQQILLDNVQTENKEITLNQFIASNPRTRMLLLVSVAGLFLVLLIIIFALRLRAAKRKALQAKHYENLAELIEEYIFEYDYKHHKWSMDHKGQQDFQMESEVLFSDKDQYMGDNEMLKKVVDQVQVCKQNEKHISEIFSHELEDHTEWYRVAISVIYEKDGKKPVHLIGKIMNVDNEVQEQEKLRLEGMTDVLTGLFNRAGLEMEYQRIIKQESKIQSYLFAMIDMDDFKGVNDTLGHHGGDIALRYLSTQLKTLYGKNCVAARIGGDEFTVFATGISIEEADKMFNRLVRMVHMEVKLNDKSRIISISLGAVYTTNKMTLEEGMKKADIALYEKKKAGKNGYLLKDLEE